MFLKATDFCTSRPSTLRKYTFGSGRIRHDEWSSVKKRNSILYVKLNTNLNQPFGLSVWGFFLDLADPIITGEHHVGSISTYHFRLLSLSTSLQASSSSGSQSALAVLWMLLQRQRRKWKKRRRKRMSSSGSPRLCLSSSAFVALRGERCRHSSERSPLFYRGWKPDEGGRMTHIKHTLYLLKEPVRWLVHYSVITL